MELPKLLQFLINPVQTLPPTQPKYCKTRKCNLPYGHDVANEDRPATKHSGLPTSSVVPFTSRTGPARRLNTVQRNLARQTPSTFEQPRRNPKRRESASYHNYS